eukprot:3494777-Prorocentrum_lima.AAC.1
MGTLGGPYPAAGSGSPPAETISRYISRPPRHTLPSPPCRYRVQYGRLLEHMLSGDSDHAQ